MRFVCVWKLSSHCESVHRDDERARVTGRNSGVRHGKNARGGVEAI